MKRRSKISGARAKARRPKAEKLNRRDAPKSAPSSPRGDLTEVVRLTRALQEALEQQTATSEVARAVAQARARRAGQGKRLRQRQALPPSPAALRDQVPPCEL